MNDRDDARSLGDGLAAEADGRDERCGDEEHAFHAVVRSRRVGHEAKILASSLSIRSSHFGMAHGHVTAEEA